jgi:hypothetical protein
MWSTQVFVLDDDGGEVITVTTAGERPNVKVGQPVSLSKLEARRGRPTGVTAWHSARRRSGRSEWLRPSLSNRAFPLALIAWVSLLLPDA